MFALRLNQEKSYFKGFTSKFQGIAEAESEAEQSVRLDAPPSTEVEKQKTKKSTEEAKVEKEGSEESESGDDESSSSDQKSETKENEFSDGKASSQDEEEKEEEDEEEAEPKPEVNINSFYSPDGILRDPIQQMREETYKQPLQPEILKTVSKWRKLEILKIFEATKAQCYLFNFIAEDYTALLRKLWALVDVFPSSLKFLILWLPKGEAKVDLFWAKRIQEAVCRRKSSRLQTLVLFIRSEDRKRLVNQFWGVG